MHACRARLPSFAEIFESVKGGVSLKMLPKSAGAAKHSARNPIHITSHDKRLLEELLAETEALRPESRSDLKALAEELKRAIIVEPEEGTSRRHHDAVAC